MATADGDRVPRTSERSPDDAAAIPVDVVGSIGGPTSSSWREQALTRIAELEDLAYAFRDPEKQKEVLAARIHRHLLTARDAADGNGHSSTRGPRHAFRRLRGAISGSALERTATHIDAAEADLLRLATPNYFASQLPGLLTHVRCHLPIDDPRRQYLEVLWLDSSHRRLTAVERAAIIAIARGASREAREEIVRVRSFRNILCVTSALLALVAGTMVTIGARSPDVIPLCFTPGTTIVCPTGVSDGEGAGAGGQPSAEGTGAAAAAEAASLDAGVRRTAAGADILVVALLGLLGASLAAAFSLRRIRGTTTPYALPVALAILKLPSGVLTAILGIQLMRGGFVPGLSDLDTSAQILAWAILFGYAQQVFTRLVDDRAHEVLDEVGGQPQPRSAMRGDASAQHIHGSEAEAEQPLELVTHGNGHQEPPPHDPERNASGSG